MELNNTTLDAFRKDFKAAMQPLQEKYDVSISLGRITYSEERFSGKLTVTNGLDPEEAARHAFDEDVWSFEELGLAPGMFNRVFIGTDGQRYAIRGFNTRAKKYPIRMLRISDGEARVCNRHFIKQFEDEYYVGVVGDNED